MLAIYYHIIPENLDVEALKKEVRNLPKLIQKKLSNYQNYNNWKSSAIGYLLLKQALLNENQSQLLKNFSYAETGKPIFQNSNWHFNISHSESFVICVLCNNSEIGIDVQAYKKLQIERYKRHFNADEWEQIITHSDVSKAFCQLWSKKEAVIKADGRGLDIPLKDVKISDNNQVNLYQEDWILTELNLHGNYTIHLATKRKFEHYKIIESKY
jgi:4'-phosphopantetheinyl transferase